MEKKKLERLDCKVFRNLRQPEFRQVQGNVRTLTLCSFFAGKIDGDIFEC